MHILSENGIFTCICYLRGSDRQCNFSYRAIKESSIETDGMEKEFIPGLMVQNLKVTLKMTRKKVLVHFSFQVEINLRFV